MPVSIDSNTRAFQLSEFKRYKTEYLEKYKDLYCAFFSYLEEKIANPDFPMDDIRSINILIGLRVFSIRIIKFSLNHESPETAIDVISILKKMGKFH
jgi:hypothetical protein